MCYFLIPGCVGRGVRLGSENCPAAEPAAASGHLGTWKSGNLGIWKSGDIEIQKFEDLGTWKSRKLGSKK